MKKNIFIYLPTILSCYNLFAQPDMMIQVQNRNMVQIQGHNINKLLLEKDNTVIGSKYLNDEFTLARINNFNENRLIRFNIFDNKFELKDKDGNIIEIDKTYTNIQFLNGDKYSLITFRENNKTINQLYLKNISNYLYELKKITFTPSKQATSSYDTFKPAKFNKALSTYIIKYNDDFIEIPKKQKDLEKLFPEKALEIKSFIKSNKIKLDKEDDLLKLTDFLNK